MSTNESPHRSAAARRRVRWSVPVVALVIGVA
jgi:hypothetical protein